MLFYEMFELQILGIAGLHQYQNANLAMHLVQKYFECRGVQVDDLSNLLSHSFEHTKWPGRCQTVPDPNNTNLTWYLDGAHTEESIKSCMQWFLDCRSSSASNRYCALICSGLMNIEAVF